MSDDLLACRRAIEAVRAGVPNRDAVRALGCSQPHIEEKFQQGLGECRELAEQGKQARSLLVAGDFGAGKSHLLEHLHHLAIEQNFVSSKVVISKETPLYDSSKFYRSAIDAAVVPGMQGGALREIAQTLDTSPGYVAFFQHVTSGASDLDSRFGATLYIYEKGNDVEWQDKVISFWSGRKLNVTEIRKALRALGESVTYPLRQISERELSQQRFRFAAQLMVAAGYSGWVLLVDEVELIGQYSWLQRAKSYAELARWMGVLGEDRGYPAIFTVFAITPDFETRVLVDPKKNDLDNVSARLVARGAPDDLLLANEAEKGMREIQKAVKLKPLDRDQVEAVGGKLREIHAKAYQWNPPAIQLSSKGLRSTPMRTHVRTWVNQWDMERLYPDYQPDIETVPVEQRLEEDKDLEVSTEENEGGDATAA